MYRTNSTGYTGVTRRSKNGKYEAYACIGGKTIRLGSFDDVHDAGCAASDWRLQHEQEIADVRARDNAKRSVSIRKALSKRSSEDHKRAIREGRERMGAKARSEATRKGRETMGHDACSAAAKRGWETRRKNQRLTSVA